jgi:dienelactone hydrolase
MGDRFMGSFLALLAFLQTAGVHVERVSVPGPDGASLDAALVLPSGPAKTPGIVGLHGCGGPFPPRDGAWAVTLAKAGHIVLLPDSFGSRNLPSQCSSRQRTVTAGGVRRKDAIAAAAWLAARPGTPAGGVVLMGWSDGGSTVLATARASAPDVPPGLFRRFVAFYPGCGPSARDGTWQPSAPLMILIGESDDWTPAASCHDLAARISAGLTLIAYPGAYHEFDLANFPVHVRSGAASTPTGWAHVGTDEPARQDAFARVPPWIEQR